MIEGIIGLILVIAAPLLAFGWWFREISKMSDISRRTNKKTTEIQRPTKDEVKRATKKGLDKYGDVIKRLANR